MERQLAELATGLLARGYGVTVVARSCQLAEHPCLRFVRVAGPRRPFSLWYPWFFVLGSLAVRRHRVGLVHTTGALVFGSADLSTVHFCHLAFRSLARAPRAARSSWVYGINARAADLMSRLAERYCYRPKVTGRLVGVSDGVARELCELFPLMEVSVIPNGVDPGTFVPDARSRETARARLGFAHDDLVALFVGGDWERKGLRHAIEGVAGAAGWQLVVVGNGDVERYRALAIEAGAGDRVRFEGGTADTRGYYAGADLLLLPTTYEAFPLVVLEAAASGLPLLVSRVNGVEDLLAEGRNGWFIDRDGRAIAERLEALRDKAVRRAMGEAAREASLAFSWDRAVDAYDRLYRELLAGR